jgi:hypothetical protein
MKNPEEYLKHYAIEPDFQELSTLITLVQHDVISDVTKQTIKKVKRLLPEPEYRLVLETLLEIENHNKRKLYGFI